MTAEPYRPSGWSWSLLAGKPRPGRNRRHSAPAGSPAALAPLVWPGGDRTGDGGPGPAGRTATPADDGRAAARRVRQANLAPQLRATRPPTGSAGHGPEAAG
jgi:hypothetical protein